jgi:hypothetical protein
MATAPPSDIVVMKVGELYLSSSSSSERVDLVNPFRPQP